MRYELLFALLILATPLLATSAHAQGPMPEPNTAGLVVNGIEVVGGELGIIAFIINPLIADTIADGTQRVLLEVRELDDPDVQNDDTVTVGVYQGLDQDANPGDDFSGEEPFEIDPTSLTPEGDPVVLFSPGSLTAGALVAGPSVFDIGGGIVLEDVILEGTMATGGASFFSSTQTGAVPTQIFEQIPAPFPFSGSLLDVLLFLGADIDVDLDGDGVNDAFSVDFVFTAVSCVILHPVTGTPFQRGDCNNDGLIGIADAITSLNALFAGAMVPGCVKACDISDDGVYGIEDPINFLNFQFLSGAPPAAPFGACGLDPTDDPLTCETFSACP